MTRAMTFVVSGFAACALALALGCAGSQETRTETTVTRSTAPVEVASAGHPASGEAPMEGETTTTTTTTSSSNQPESVLGATVNAIGTVILFPFRVLFDALGYLL